MIRIVEDTRITFVPSVRLTLDPRSVSQARQIEGDGTMVVREQHKLTFRAMRATLGAVTALMVWSGGTAAHAEPRYAWMGVATPAAVTAPPATSTLAARIAPPAGFTRVAAETGSWAEWLRGLPLKPEGAPVLTYTGAPKWRQDVHVAVLDIDVGKRDLQQCADAVMRLRAEWLYASNRKGEIAFNDTDGKRRMFSKQSKQDYPSFRKYMDLVFAYAGTYSLDHELKAVKLTDIQIGDVFIKGGFPGHAILVADMAVNQATGEKRFLLMQSYMPAQDIHVLKNPNATGGSPWYGTDIGLQLETPEWNFSAGQLKRWP